MCVDVFVSVDKGTMRVLASWRIYISDFLPNTESLMVTLSLSNVVTRNQSSYYDTFSFSSDKSTTLPSNSSISGPMSCFL